MATTKKTVKRFNLTPEIAANLQAAINDEYHFSAAERQALVDVKEFWSQGHPTNSRKFNKEIGTHLGTLIDIAMRLSKLTGVK